MNWPWSRITRALERIAASLEKQDDAHDAMERAIANQNQMLEMQRVTQEANKEWNDRHTKNHDRFTEEYRENITKINTMFQEVFGRLAKLESKTEPWQE